MRYAAAILPALSMPVAAQDRLPLFDVHVHYSHDAVELLPPKDAVAVVRRTGAGQYPEAIVLWAHSGFDRPERVREMLRKHKNLWADLAFRNDQANGDVVATDWKAAFEEFPDRFMVGTDTFTPERWHYVGAHADFSRRWLSSLPKAIAERIAYKNAEAMLKNVSPGPAGVTR